MNTVQLTAVATATKSHLASDHNFLETATYTSKEYIKRGKNDKILLEFHTLVSDSSNKWQAIETKANFIYGQGLNVDVQPAFIGPEKEKEDPKKKDLVKKYKLNNLLMSAAFQLAFADELNILVEFSEVQEIPAKLTVLDNNDVRVARLNPNDRTIKYFFISTEFGKKTLTHKDDYRPIPAFDPINPRINMISIIHVIMPKPGQRFYGLPSWWGTKKWTEVSNDIPVYYEATMKNGAFLAYHYKYPKRRYEDLAGTEEEKKAIKEADFDGIVDSVSGVKNANKFIFTPTEYDPVTQKLEEVTLEVIKGDPKDNAFMQMGEMGAIMQLSGHGVPPRLAGISLGGGMSSSGKEVVSEANFMQDYLMPLYRAKIVEPINIFLGSIGEFDEFEIKRIESYTYDVTAVNAPDNPNSQSR